MTTKPFLAAILSSTALLASCGSPIGGETSAQSTPAPTTGSASATAMGEPQVTAFGTYDEPWAAAFAPGTSMLFITEKPGTMKFIDTETRRTGTVTGLPRVDYGGQGGLGEIAFLDSQRAATVGSRTIYLSWVEAGQGDTRGAVVGRGTLNCGTEDANCKIEGLETIWRQSPKVTRRGHYSHRIVFSPDERYMFVSSGERQKGTPAQDTSNTLGTIVRLNLDGTPAAGNPLAAQGSPSDQIWSWGHRNILAMDFDAEGRLWEIEHGPAGGDELNLVQKGGNYGWPNRSFGDEYNGTPIPDHTADDGFIKPVIDWTPVIASGNFFIYDGDLFAPWRGQGIIAGLKTQALIRIAFDGDTAREVGRIPMGERIRQVVQGPDGAIWALEDGEGGRLLKLTPG